MWVGALGGESVGRPAEEQQPETEVVSELPTAERGTPSEGPCMGRKRYTVEQIITKLREAEVELAQGSKTPEVWSQAGDLR